MTERTLSLSEVLAQSLAVAEMDEEVTTEALFDEDEDKLGAWNGAGLYCINCNAFEPTVEGHGAQTVWATIQVDADGGIPYVYDWDVEDYDDLHWDGFTCSSCGYEGWSVEELVEWREPEEDD